MNISKRERFYGKVLVRSDAECWPWLGFIGPDGYGTFWVNELQRMIGAHVVSYCLEYGRPENNKKVDNKEICHSCDNPSCVNPKHLFLGTHKDNMEDCRKKDRNAYGTRHYKSKLSDEDIIFVKNWKGPIKTLAIKFNMQYSHLCRIRSGSTDREKKRRALDARRGIEDNSISRGQVCS